MAIAVGAPASAEEIETREREAVDAYCPLALGAWDTLTSLLVI